MKNKAYLIIGSVALILGLFLLGIKFYNNSQEAKVAEVAESDKGVFIRDYSPQLGRQSATVDVVEFLDPECESCRAFYPSTKMLLQDFEGQVRLTIRYAAFHPNSSFAIKILEAARKQNRYWETLEVLFRYQPEWGDHHHPQPELIWKYLPEAGLDLDRIRVDMQDPEIERMIAQDAEDGQKLGVRMTPTFFINGKMLTRFSYEALVEAVERALSE